MEDIIQKVKNNWKNCDELSMLLVLVSQLHWQKAEELTASVQEFADAFLAEKESSYKATIAEVEYRLKAAYGGRAEMLRFQLESLRMLAEAVRERLRVLEGLEETARQTTDQDD